MMRAEIWRLSYSSRRPCLPELAATQIAAIEAAATENNRRADLMGALACSDSRFAQVLEGPRDALERTFERICYDTRHDDVLVIGYGPTETMAFAEFRIIAMSSNPDPAAEGLTAGEAMLAHLQASMNRLEPSTAPMTR